MYAIVNIAGQQFKVSEKQEIYVHRLPGEAGDSVTLGEVLLLDENGKVTVGAPHVAGAGIQAKIVNHVKGDKVIIFKKKRRKGYQKMNGHRQQFTRLAIESINTK